MSDLDRQFPGKLVAQNVDATTPDSKRAVEELEFGNHGLVIRTADGEVLWKQPDHEVDMDAARKALNQLLEGR